MKSTDFFIQDILRTTQDVLLVRFWQQQLERKAAIEETNTIAKEPASPETVSAEVAVDTAGPINS